VEVREVAWAPGDGVSLWAGPGWGHHLADLWSGTEWVNLIGRVEYKVFSAGTEHSGRDGSKINAQLYIDEAKHWTQY